MTLPATVPIMLTSVAGLFAAILLAYAIYTCAKKRRSGRADVESVRTVFIMCIDPESLNAGSPPPPSRASSPNTKPRRPSQVSSPGDTWSAAAGSARAGEDVNPRISRGDDNWAGLPIGEPF